MVSPHLPAPTCNVSTRKNLNRLGLLFFVVFMAFVSGLSGAMIAVSWLYPTYQEGQIIRTSVVGRADLVPDAVLTIQTRQKILTIFDKRKKIDGKFYGTEAIVNEAAVISSDGWAVAYLNNFVSGQEKNWELQDNQGNSYAVDKFAYDAVSSLLYLKVNGSGLRAMVFLNTKNLSKGTALWSFHNKNWKNTVLGDYKNINANKKVYLIWLPQYEFSLSSELEAGSLVIDDNGQFVGFVGDKANLIGSVLIENQISSVLGSGTIKYFGLSESGYIIKSALKDNYWQDLLGYYIMDAGGNYKTTLPLKGDVIVNINNEPVDEYNIYRQILQAPNEFNLTVLRDGKEVELKVKKTTVSG